MNPIRPLTTRPLVTPTSALALREVASGPKDLFEPGGRNSKLLAGAVGGSVVGSAVLGAGTSWLSGTTEVLVGMAHGSVVGAALGGALGVAAATFMAGPDSEGRLGSIGTALVGGALGGVAGFVGGGVAGAYVGNALGNVLGYTAGALLGGGGGYLAARRFTS